MAPTKEELPVAAARAGEREAWDILFRRYQLPLYAYVFELVRHEATSLDLVQESFINAARHIARLRDDGRFGSWLFGIAHQKCAQHWRQQRHPDRVAGELPDDLPGPEDDPCGWLIRQEDEEAFRRLLNALSPPQRSVLLLHFIEEFPLDEIAEITETTLGTVKSRIHYAKRSLRKLIEEQI